MKISISKCREPDIFDGSKQLRFDTLDVDSLSSAICDKPWSNIEWNGTRDEKNFVQANFIALDFDGGATILEIFRWAKALRLTFSMGPTRNHLKEKKKKGYTEPACERFRLILETDGPCTSLEDYRYTAKYFIDELGADKSCRDGARFYFPCTEIMADDRGGRKTGWLKKPKNIVDDKQNQIKNEISRSELKGTMPKWVRRLLENGAPLGERHKKCYAVAKALFEYEVCATASEAHEMLTRSPFIEIDDNGTYIRRTCERARETT